MVSKWWGVGLIVVLGVVWFVLAELPARTATQAAAPAAVAPAVVAPAAVAAAAAPAQGVSMKAPAAPASPATAAAPPVTAPPVPAATNSPALRHDAAPGAATPAQSGSAPADASGAATPPAGSGMAIPIEVPSTPPASAGANDAIATANKQRAAGDLAGAEATLRAAMSRAGNAAEAARAGLFLAPLARDLKERRQLLTAALLESVVVGAEYEEVGNELAEINRSPGTSLQGLLQVETYTVAGGDSLWKLCNKTFPKTLGVTPEIGLVKLVNGITKDTLRVGQKIIVPKGAPAIRVDTRQHGLALFVGDVAVTAYRVGLGKENRTPHGDFTIRDKQENPAWFNDGRTIPFGDPENVLGTRWMGFDDRPGAMGFGIHGTADPGSIGGNESMGCVRMRNDQVEELFGLVPRGTPVAIL